MSCGQIFCDRLTGFIDKKQTVTILIDLHVITRADPSAVLNFLFGVRVEAAWAKGSAQHGEISCKPRHDCVRNRYVRVRCRPRFFAINVDFEIYVRNNRKFIPNFGERYRQGETISTAFVESTINQVVSRRFVKKQQMQWTLKGAHLLLQTRTKVLNNELESIFRRWHPQFHAQQKAVA
jgi:hypothetical protein